MDVALSPSLTVATPMEGSSAPVVAGVHIRARVQ